MHAVCSNRVTHGALGRESRMGGKRADGDTAAASSNRNDRGVSGGHLRHGHFVLSPCSVFTVDQRSQGGHLRAAARPPLAAALFYKRPPFLMISRVKRN